MIESLSRKDCQNLSNEENLSQAALTRKYGDQKFQTTIEHRWPNTRTIARPLKSHVNRTSVPGREPPPPGANKTANIVIDYQDTTQSTVIDYRIYSLSHSFSNHLRGICCERL